MVRASYSELKQTVPSGSFSCLPSAYCLYIPYPLLNVGAKAALFYTLRVCLSPRVTCHLHIHVPALQWVLDSTSPEKKGDVKAKQLEALKRLGHAGLQLDEYESMCGHSIQRERNPDPLVQKPWRMKLYTPTISKSDSTVSNPTEKLVIQETLCIPLPFHLQISAA